MTAHGYTAVSAGIVTMARASGRKPAAEMVAG